MGFLYKQAKIIAAAVAYTKATLTQTLNDPNVYGTSANDHFGHSVAVSGNYAIVGHQAGVDAGATFSGKAFVYNVTTGALIRTLSNPNQYGTSSSTWGTAVAISGNYAIVGASYEYDAGLAESGKAYIFNITTGALIRTLNNPNAYGTSFNDLFGFTVAISGNYAIVGAQYEDDADGSFSGKVYIFDVTTGTLLRTLNNPNVYGTSFNDQFGSSIAISGNYAIVGAQYEGDTGGASSGKAYIFNITTGALIQTLANPNVYGTSFNDQFGSSIAISGNYAIVSARYEGDASGTYSGKAYIFNITTGALVSTLNNPNAYGTSGGDLFGYSVALNGNYAVVGAVGEGDTGGASSGKAYIFDATTGALILTLKDPNAYGTSAGDNFGYSVALDGNYVVIGAIGEDDAGGAYSGKTYIFQLS